MTDRIIFGREHLKSRKEEAIFRLDRLTSEERLQVFHLYCLHCGIQQPEDSIRGCQCWNDE
jgi:hypothetical protein